MSVALGCWAGNITTGEVTSAAVKMVADSAHSALLATILLALLQGAAVLQLHQGTLLHILDPTCQQWGQAMGQRMSKGCNWAWRWQGVNLGVVACIKFKPLCFEAPFPLSLHGHKTTVST